MDDTVYAHLWHQRCDVLFKARVQGRYHRYRQRFFDLADKLIKAATLLLGASLFGQALNKQVPMLAIGISALSLIALVFGLGDRKHLHKDLAEMANKLEADIVCIPADELNAKITAGWEAEFARLCAKSPPVLKTLTLMCEREQSIVDGHPNAIAAQSFFKRLVRHFN